MDRLEGAKNSSIVKGVKTVSCKNSYKNQQNKKLGKN